jgi:hypothetical protein
MGSQLTVVFIATEGVQSSARSASRVLSCAEVSLAETESI